MSAWSGGAFDTRRDRLILWGGGHTDYAGNEIYVFDIATLKWKRVNDPSSDVGGVESSGLYPDGKPRSRHTYNSVQYLPTLDRFCAFGGVGYYPSGQVGNARTDCFDFETGQWEKKSSVPELGTANLSAMDPITGEIWTGKGTLTRYLPETDAWGKATAYDNTVFWELYLTLDLDPKRRKLVAVGGGKVYVWNFSDLNRAIPAEPLITTGDTAIIHAHSPGMAYDPVGDRMVAWSGGADVYTLNLDTRVWTRHAKTGGPTPPAANGTGTFGRFRYVASKNVFVTVNRSNENLFFYKLTPGGGLPVVHSKAGTPGMKFQPVRRQDGGILFRTPREIGMIPFHDLKGRVFPQESKIWQD
jgi:hypothetical protein